MDSKTEVISTRKKDLPRAGSLLSSSWNRQSGLQDRHGFSLVQQDVGAEANGFLSAGMMDDDQIPERSMGGPFVHLPKASTFFQPAIAQGFHVPGVGRILEQHRVMEVAVLTGLFSTSRIQVLQQHDGEQVQMVAAAH